MGGRIISTDVCKECNVSFGQTIDPALLCDGSSLMAAQRAGVKLTELLTQFEGYHHTVGGRPVKTKVRKGLFHPKPEFHDEGFQIAMTEGKFRPDDLRNAKGKMFVIVKRNVAVSLSDHQICGEIDKLFHEAERNPDRVVFNPTIGQGLKGELLDREVRDSWTYHPWETQWTIAKIAYEFSLVLWPNEYVRYFAPVLTVFRRFIEERKVGLGIFKQYSLDQGSRKAHEFECLLSPRSLSLRIVLFGVAVWSFEKTLRHHPNAPRSPYRIRVYNPFRDPKTPASVEIEPLLQWFR